MGLVQSISWIYQVMLRITNIVVVSSIADSAKEDLGIANGPVSHEQHANWCILNETKELLLEHIIIHWWLPEIVKKCPLFNDIHIHDSEHANRDQNRKEEPVCEADEDLSHDWTVLEMHHVLGSWVHRNVLERRRCLRRISVTAVAALVKHLLQLFNSTEDRHFCIWVECHNKHGLHQSGTNLFVPVLVEVWILLVQWQES